MKSKKGSTLIEVILTLALIGIVIQILYSLYFASNISYSLSTNRGFAQQDIRTVSDFLNNELRYVTDIDNADDFGNKYYSLKVEEIGDKKVLIKTLHEYNGDGTEIFKEDVTLKTTINKLYGRWNKFIISNSEPGVISIIIKQEEGSRNKTEYELPVKVNTVNNESLQIFESIDLLAGGILYYQNNKTNSLTRGIDIHDNSAVIVPNIKSVSFDSQGGSTVTSFNKSGYVGTTVNMPTPNPTKIGYSFRGWYSEPNGKGEHFNETKVIIQDENITIFAYWEYITQKIPEVKIGNILKIDNKTPSKNKDGRYEIVRKNQGIGGSYVEIQLVNYDLNVHSSINGNVKLKVGNAVHSINENGNFTIFVSADSNGTVKFEVEITIITEGYYESKETFEFIAN